MKTLVKILKEAYLTIIYIIVFAFMFIRFGIMDEDTGAMYILGSCFVFNLFILGLYVYKYTKKN